MSELLETLIRGFTASYKSCVRREGLGDGQDFWEVPVFLAALIDK